MVSHFYSKHKRAGPSFGASVAIETGKSSKYKAEGER